MLFTFPQFGATLTAISAATAVPGPIHSNKKQIATNLEVRLTVMVFSSIVTVATRQPSPEIRSRRDKAVNEYRTLKISSLPSAIYTLSLGGEMITTAESLVVKKFSKEK